MTVPKPFTSPHAERLAKPAVHAAIESLLGRRGIPADDLEDLRQVVLAQALGTATPPPDLEQCIAFVRKIARDVANDYFRSRAVRGKYDAGPYEDADAHPAGEPPDAADPIDLGKQVAVIQREIEAGRISVRQASILARAVEGVPQQEIAASLGVAHQTVRNELSAARRTARLSWAAYVAAATLLGAVALVCLTRNRGDRPSYSASPPPMAPNDTSTPAPVSASSPAMARDLRLRAKDDDRAGRWIQCVLDLDRAARLDPAGDADPEWQRLRDSCSGHAPTPKPAPEKGMPEKPSITPQH